VVRDWKGQNGSPGIIIFRKVILCDDWFGSDC
jgi:hypothetical protein